VRPRFDGESSNALMVCGLSSSHESALENDGRACSAAVRHSAVSVLARSLEAIPGSAANKDAAIVTEIRRGLTEKLFVAVLRNTVTHRSLFGVRGVAP